MRYRVLPALIVVPALAGCGTAAGVTTGGNASGKPAPRRSTPIHATCSKSDRRKPVSHASGAAALIVPGHPQAALLCRYSGLNGHPRFALIGQRKITNAQSVARLAHELDALPKGPEGTAINCPADFGDAVLIFFAYAGGAVDPVTVALSGCGAVTNGHLTRLAGLAKSPVTGQLKSQTYR
jgi:hypothetical protein